jgi:sec-independent protein translocase protein TatA
MGLGGQHILLLVIVALLLFSRGKISELMGDVGKGIKSFRRGMAEDQASISERPISDTECQKTDSTRARK